MISITVRPKQLLFREAFLRGHEMTNQTNMHYLFWQINRK